MSTSEQRQVLAELVALKDSEPVPKIGEYGVKWRARKREYGIRFNAAWAAARAALTSAPEAAAVGEVMPETWRGSPLSWKLALLAQDMSLKDEDRLTIQLAANALTPPSPVQSPEHHLPDAGKTIAQSAPPQAAQAVLSDDQIKAAWKAWPKQSITGARKAISFVRFVLAAQGTQKAEATQAAAGDEGLLQRLQTDVLWHRRRGNETIAKDIEEAIAVLTPPPAAPVPQVPEGCTPADAKMLRSANHALAQESHELQEALADLYGQVKRFCEIEGEADFETGRALCLLSRLRPLEFNWPFASAPSQPGEKG